LGKGQFTEKEGMAEAERRIEEARKQGATELDLSGLRLTDLPGSIAQLRRLHRLNLYNNQLTALPESIAQLGKLWFLDVHRNQLTALPESIARLRWLQSLNLYGNQLTALPEPIAQLQQLQSLSVWNNQLTALPESIGQLQQLQKLDVSNNQLTALPESIAQLQKLWFLDVHSNQLTALPESIAQLQKLQYLYVQNNQLSALPVSLWKLRDLTHLFLHGNAALGLPAEILGPIWLMSSDKPPPAKPGEILEYYYRLRGGKHPLNEAKLILVGRGAVGKTSTVNRLVRNHFEKDAKKTEGIKITEWPVTLNQTENVRLNIWDFGGQEIMHATHQFFLTQRSLYLVVLSGREGSQDTDAEYWLRLIESFAGDSPVIVVLNKIREYPFDLNRRALQQKFPAIREFIKTDCADGTGIKELRWAIECETDRLEHLRDPFPASWFAIKDRLAGMRENYLSFDEYRGVCGQFEEKDETAQEALAGNLHHLGVVLNFRDDPRLQYTYVLSPHWATDGIYSILNSKRLADEKGEIRLGELAGILDRERYPGKMHGFLLDLMKKFQLCFSYPNDDTHYLIPELLGEQQPEAAAEFKPEECLNFQYHYPVLPEGLLPRFIVRSHLLSEGQPRWRTGVILKFEGCRALVKADLQDKKVFVSVSGGQGQSRRRLLAIIRIYLEEIHGNIRRLQQVEMVPLPGYPGEVVPYKKLLTLEKNRELELKEVVGEKVIKLNVLELLNGVDLEGTRVKDERGTETEGEAVRLFYSYSHKDESLRNELETHLKLLERQGYIRPWHDRRIEAGDDFKDKIDENLKAANIILLLVSADFIASKYCYEIEMECALERERKGEARVIPVIVRDLNWPIAPFAHLQALPKDGKAVMLWPDRDTAWRNVSEGIERVVEGIRKKRSGGLT